MPNLWILPHCNTVTIKMPLNSTGYTGCFWLNNLLGLFFFIQLYLHFLILGQTFVNY